LNNLKKKNHIKIHIEGDLMQNQNEKKNNSYIAIIPGSLPVPHSDHHDLVMILMKYCLQGLIPLI